MQYIQLYKVCKCTSFIIIKLCLVYTTCNLTYVNICNKKIKPKTKWLRNKWYIIMKTAYNFVDELRDLLYHHAKLHISINTLIISIS